MNLSPTQGVAVLRGGSSAELFKPLIAAMIAIVTVHVAPGRSLANSNAADTTNADQLWEGGGLGLSLTGAGVTVGVWEAGSGGEWDVRHTHEAFGSYIPRTGVWTGPTRVTFGDTFDEDGAYSSHATHVAGIIGGAHIPGNESTWGMAPGVDIISYSAGSAIDEIEAATNVDISNHSYGSPRSPWDETEWSVSNGSGGTVTLTYDTWSFDWDTTNKDPGYGNYNATARNLDLALNARPKLLSFWSAGNSRNNADDRYDDLQNDGKFVTRFSDGYIAGNSIIGEDLGDRYYLVSTSDYPLDPHGFDVGGYDGLTGTGVAKNNVVVGAISDFQTDPHPDSAGGISTASFSTYGPTDDGRLGVDLVANGVSVRSSTNSSDTAYSNASGTSMSSPNAAGSAALVLEHWRHENGGLTPDSATQKGLLMHTATDASSYGFGPDYATGYGLLDAAEAVQHITEAFVSPLLDRDRHVWEDTLQQGETLTFDFLTAGDEFKASLSWLDPASSTTSGLDNRTIKLVNDLDVWVTDEFGNTHWTWTLDPDNPAGAATRDEHNRVDNFTQVYIDSLALDTELTLHINHFGGLSGGSQDFALFVTGATLLDFLLGDLNQDQLINVADWNLFKQGFGLDLTSLSADDAYALGDLDGDFDNDLDDLDLFRRAYEELFGQGSFSTLTSSVPEPSTAVLLVAAVCFGFATRRRITHSSAHPMLAVVVASGVMAGFADRRVDAADITWRNPVSIGTSAGNSADVNNTFGTVIEAYTATTPNSPLANQAVTVNGITFEATTDLLPGQQGAATDFSVATNPATSGGDTAYDDLVSSFEYGGTDDPITIAIGDGDGDGSVVGTGSLVVGHAYQLQVWYVDDRTNFSDRQMQFGDGNGNTVSLKRQYALGTFIADATTQNLTLDALDFNAAHITAYALTGGVELPSVQVNMDTGEITLRNNGATGVDMRYYELSSASASLSPGDWLSLEDGAGVSEGFLPGDGSGNGWEELGDPSNFLSPPNSSQLAEAYLLGSSSLSPGGAISLGEAFDTTGMQDLEFHIELASGQLFSLPVQEVTSVDGDYNHNGVVDIADYVVWQTSFGSTTSLDADGNDDGIVDAADYTFWRDRVAVSASTTIASPAAVPEPSVLGMLASILALLFCCSRSRLLLSV